MPDSTSLGRGLHRSKSINVEANILNEWQFERQSAVDAIRYRTIILGGLIAFSTISIPLARAFADEWRAMDIRQTSERRVLEKKLKMLEADGEHAQPVIAYDKQTSQEHANAQAMLGNLILIINAAPQKVAISKLKAAVTGGELSVELSADSEDSDSAKLFASEAGKGSGVLYTVLASTKKSALLGPDGLGFDIQKKVSVAQ